MNPIPIGMLSRVFSAPSSAVLDSWNTGLRAAYSTRLLFSDYSGPLLRVKRSSDNSELDIGQVGGSLDTGTLLAFVGAGNGTVVTWYDQAGSLNVVGTGTTQIVTSGALRVLPGSSVPAVYVSGSTSGFSGGPTIGTAATPLSLFGRISVEAGGFGVLMSGPGSSNDYAGVWHAGSGSPVAGHASSPSQYVDGVLSTRADAFTYTLNSDEVLAITFTTDGLWPGTPARLFMYGDVVNPLALVSDWVMYDSVKSADDVSLITGALRQNSTVFQTNTALRTWALTESGRYARALTAGGSSVSSAIKVRSRIPASGNTYFEVQITAGTTAGVGISNVGHRPTIGDGWWNTETQAPLLYANGNVYSGYASPDSGLGSFATATIGVLIKNSKCYFRRLGYGSNDGWASGVNIATETGAHKSGLTGFFDIMAFAYCASTPEEFRLLLAPSDLTMSLPSGASTLLP